MMIFFGPNQFHTGNYSFYKIEPETILAQYDRFYQKKILIQKTIPFQKYPNFLFFRRQSFYTWRSPVRWVGVGENGQKKKTRFPVMVFCSEGIFVRFELSDQQFSTKYWAQTD